MSHAASKARLILTALADGPATTTELADALEMDRHFVRGTVGNMYRSRYLTREIFTRNGRSRATYLYRISGLGRRKVAIGAYAGGAK